MKVHWNQRPTFLLVLFSLLLLWQLPADCFAAFEERGNSPVALGLGCSLASDPVDPSGRAWNPAAASFTDQFAFRIGYARPFGLKELDRIRLDLVYPFGARVAGLSLSSFGGELYSERQLSLSLSQRSGPLAFGAALGHQQININNYGSDHAWFADAGLLLHLGMVQLGAGGTNLVSTTMERYGTDQVPRQGVVSLRFLPDSRYALLLETQFEKYMPPAFHFGGEVEIYANLRARLGYDTATNRMHLGLGISVEGLMMDGSYDNHPYLGWTRAFGFGWGVRPHAAD
ncbi:hypothetical protein KQI63_11200 [bacterium]|nr:hypothetical protein [bacterium]